MASLKASAEFRTSNPKGSTQDEIASDAPQLRELAQKFPTLLIYTPSAEAYEQVRPYFNAAVTQQPLAIARPRSVEEVSAVVREAQSKGIPFGIRAGGHDMSGGQAQGKDGIIIDLRAIDGAEIAEDRKSVRVGGGAVSINLAKFLNEHDLVTPHGWCATVGVAGWVLGGGYGYSSAFYGLGVDQVLGAKLVLAGGRVVDTDDHPDLLWALRGAGNGTFGIVVELRLKLYDPTAFLGGLVGFPSDETADVLAKFGEFERDLPVNFTGEISQMTLPGVGPLLVWIFAWTSDDDNLEEGWAFLKKLKSLGTPLLDTVAQVDDYTFFNSFPYPANVHWYPRLRAVEYLSPEVSQVIADNLAPGPASVTVIHKVHGRALGENPGACFPLRKPHRLVNPTAAVSDASTQASDFEEYKKWARGFVEELSDEGLALPYGYRNLGPDEDTNWVATYGEETLARLKDIKLKFDPDDVFDKGHPRF
ncbi:FAD-linked oxidoreductase aurO [Colletotrichum orbiculare MAFF 240422]|uniref:FAD-linked oxidoreductase aurO n=1 Tax=Colletotrichum orbiculare (strain 104-T / ATCC 96160 / CBS 514.97 / LARS 414 / MAFF 240422) TaxID=1213857 RepID=N4VA79_COLOR|nr:FAD-linked oxidoreductase aurO [Colletotrichum orbiculare MAFF 240422]